MAAACFLIKPNARMNWRGKRRLLIGKILHGARRLRAVIGVGRHLHLAHRIRLNSEIIIHVRQFVPIPSVLPNKILFRSLINQFNPALVASAFKRRVEPGLTICRASFDGHHALANGNTLALLCWRPSRADSTFQQSAQRTF